MCLGKKCQLEFTSIFLLEFKKTLCIQKISLVFLCKTKIPNFLVSRLFGYTH